MTQLQDDHTPAATLPQVLTRIRAAENRYGRTPGSVTLLAVSKAQPAERMRALHQAGLCDFGESYLQEALTKMTSLADCKISWHFIGAIQSNKTRIIAEHFAWAQGLDRLKTAERFNEQRPPALPPLNVCIQLNIGNETQKAGITPQDASALANQIRTLPRLRLRGVMALPPPSDDFKTQRHYFRQARLCFERLRREGHALDTLSMGMSADLEAAIAEGATLVRVGTALFGARPEQAGP